MVFLSGGVTHASFGGIGAAVYAGVNPLLGALLFAVASSLGIEWASSRGKIREDSAIGMMWGIGMALGALFMSLTPGYTSGDLSSYLFGSIIAVTDSEVISLAALTAAILAGTVLWLRPVMFVAFDREYAASQGIPTAVVSYVMAALLAVTVVMSIRIMGIVLLISLLTMPVAIANVFAKSYRTIVPAAAAAAALCSLAGVAASYYLEIPSGSAIIFVLAAALIVVKLLSLHGKTISGT